ncbi:hypothetical protein OO015_01980 [Thermomicrobium sp. 4228-Ro]|uniref:molybdopterin-binding protein n=1 Tax=Thermomicrobium sp. 4228-Ro TaxID=2993937 RepID=UPI002248B0D9|nr:molybdopterin-binding protein [Thermomicrobium sp. 4228-Ro]MCX2726265.1 hypothetical protein [Thermomicrobium sp. 4228-Ro]
MRRTWYVVGSDPVPAGAILRRDVVLEADGRQQFRRGLPLEQFLEKIGRYSGIRVPIAVPDPGEIEQHAASARIAEAVTGDGTELDPPHQGQVNVRASISGVVRVDSTRLERLVRSGLALVATVLDGRVAQPGETIAIVKAPAYFVPEDRLARALGKLGGRPVVRVVPFRLRRVALLAGERVRPAAVDVAARALHEKLARFGAELVETTRLDRDEAQRIAERLAEWIDQGIELVLTAGSIMLDPDDAFLRALRPIGARLAVRGAPVDPGTMFWVAYRSEVPILGLASCELYGRVSVFDLVVPYVLAGEPVGRSLFARLAHGGLLEDTYQARLPRDWRSGRSMGS